MAFFLAHKRNSLNLAEYRLRECTTQDRRLRTRFTERELLASPHRRHAIPIGVGPVAIWSGPKTTTVHLGV